MSADTLIGWGTWAVLLDVTIYALITVEVRRCLDEARPDDELDALLAEARRVRDLWLLGHPEPEEPTEDIEEALIIANGWGPTFEEIMDLPEWCP